MIPPEFDDEAARVFDSLSALVVAAGRDPRSRSLDLMIAATADVRDFADVTSLVPVVAA